MAASKQTSTIQRKPECIEISVVYISCSESNVQCGAKKNDSWYCALGHKNLTLGLFNHLPELQRRHAFVLLKKAAKVRLVRNSHRFRHFADVETALIQ